MRKSNVYRNKYKNLIQFFTVILIFGLYIVFLKKENLWEGMLRFFFPGEKDVLYPRASLLPLSKKHLILVGISSSASILFGIVLGIYVTREKGRDFLPLVNNLTSFSQTVPPVAVLALVVPFVGFGFKPTVLALFLYSILPVVRNTIAGFEAVSRDVVDIANCIGIYPYQVLFGVELPLATRVIIAGIRTSVVINVGTASVGAVVGAGGFGVPIISGLVRDNQALIIEGALSSALLAVLIDQFMSSLEKAFFSAKD